MIARALVGLELGEQVVDEILMPCDYCHLHTLPG
jgi:hypothetical protein